MAIEKDQGRSGGKRVLIPEVGNEITARNARWTFGGNVAETFEEHIERSVPLYRQGHDLVAALSDFFLYDGAVAIELGCSTAALLRRLATRNAEKGVRFVGLELEPEMVDTARRNCAELSDIDIQHADIVETEFETADLIISYYTIQFVRPAYRQQLIDKIYQSLNWGGAFIMFEKVRAPDARFQDILSSLYVDFKLEQGFKETEIIHKTRSLKGILEPFSTRANFDMMRRAGFEDCMTVAKNLCFEGFLAIK